MDQGRYRFDILWRYSIGHVTAWRQDKAAVTADVHAVHGFLDIVGRRAEKHGDSQAYVAAKGKAVFAAGITHIIQRDVLIDGQAVSMTVAHFLNVVAGIAADKKGSRFSQIMDSIKDTGYIRGYKISEILR